MGLHGHPLPAGQHPIFDIDLLDKLRPYASPARANVLSGIFFFFSQDVEFSDRHVVVLFAFVSLFWLTNSYRNHYQAIFSRPRPFDWSKQIVVVTGGASGVGELLANTIAVRAASVVVLDIQPIVAEQHNITYYKCNVSKWEEVHAVSKRIAEEIGHPTVLVNNAGIVQGKLLVDLSANDVQQTFDVNTLAHFWTLKAFLPAMLKSEYGHIVTVASILGLSGAAQVSDYCASKAAVISLNESLRYELDNRYKCPHIRTTLVIPGHILTRMFDTVKFPSSGLFRLCFPSIPPATVVKHIVAALEEQNSKTIMVPFIVHVAPYLRHLPSFARDFFQRLSGADYSMVNFTKTSGHRDDDDGVVRAVHATKID